MNAAAPRRPLMIAAIFLVMATVPDWAASQGTAMLTSSQVMPFGFVVTRPSATTFSARNGLQLEIDSRWVNNFGYRPVRVRITADKPAKRDHRIAIRLNVASWDWRSGAIGVEQDVDLLTGQSSADAVIACPQFQTGHRYWWDVWVDGKKDDALSVDANLAWQLTAASNNGQGDALLKFLLIGGASSQPSSAMGPNGDTFEAIVMPIDELPSRWIEFASVDVLALSPKDLETLAKNHPETLTAIARWVRAGGQLWVSPVGREWQSLGKAEQLLGMPSIVAGDADLAAGESKLDDEIVERGWTALKLGSRPISTSEVTFQHLPTGRTRVVRDLAIIARMENDPDWTVSMQRTISPVPQSRDQAKLPDDSSEWYIQRPLGMGYVRAFREAWDPVGFGISLQMLRGMTIFDPAEAVPLTTPLSAAMETTRSWESRHGMTPDSANSDFADWLVPGVGQAPVTEFRVLITLFVLIIGPLNYWLLQRTQRLHLLVLTVPITAAILTAGLFAYALASDGLGTKVRVRSFTTLDQQSGEAASWARLSYYAGLAPGNGLTMPDDMVVLPILPGWNEVSSATSIAVTRQMEWSDGRQRLREGWLRSRTPTQYLTVRARQTPARLRVESDDQALRVTNELGTTIDYLAIADGDGAIYAGDAIANGASATIKAADPEKTLRRLQQYLRENQPFTPPELTDESTFFASQQRRQQRRFMRNQYGLTYALERLGGNLLNGGITSLVGTDEAPALQLPPRTFVAITETGPEVVLGVEGAREDASFHVLVGNW